MNTLSCLAEKITLLIVGFSVLGIGIAFFINSLTTLPFIGMIVALSAFAASYPLLRSAIKETCEYSGN